LFPENFVIEPETKLVYIPSSHPQQADADRRQEALPLRL